MSARAALRAATAEAHERVDRLYSRFDLNSRAGYRDFLLAQASAHLPVEQAIDGAGVEGLLDDWPSRRRAALIEADLHAIGASLPSPQPPPALNEAASVLGAIYVLEGSRLGGAVLKRMIPKDAPRAFLAAPQSAGAWRRLLEVLDGFLTDKDHLDVARDAAILTFNRFECAAITYLEQQTQ